MRYNLDFKLQVIAYYMQGHTGRATAEEFNLDNKIVIKWVKQYIMVTLNFRHNFF